MGCCGRPDPPAPAPPPPPPRAMNFAFDMGETITRYPAEFYTIMECLRRGGHKVVILSAIGLTHMGAVDEARGILSNLPFDFGHFDLVTVPEDHTGTNKANYCRENNICMLIDDAPYNIAGLHELSPATARVQVMP